MAGQLPVLNLYPHTNYPLRSKQPNRPEKDVSVAAYLDRLQHKYEREGMQTSVYGILLYTYKYHCNVDNLSALLRCMCTIILMCALKIDGNPSRYELPGGRLRPGENEIDGLKRKLCSKLGSNSSSSNQDWQIGECVGVWWRLNFDTLLYPHCFPNISTEPPKECKKLYLVHLPEHRRLFIPTNRILGCSPLLELFVYTNKVPENPPDGDNAGNDNEVSSDDNNVAVGDN